MLKILVILVTILGMVRSHGISCPCHDRFLELFKIIEEVKKIDQGYFKNQDIMEILLDVEQFLTYQLRLKSVMARSMDIEWHQHWSLFVDQLEGRMAEKPRNAGLDEKQIENLSGLIKLYQCVFNSRLMCLLGLTEYVDTILERVFLNPQIQDILYQFWELYVDLLDLTPVLNRVMEVNLHGQCNSAIDRIADVLKSTSSLDDEQIMQCQTTAKRLTAQHWHRPSNTSYNTRDDTEGHVTRLAKIAGNTCSASPCS